MAHFGNASPVWDSAGINVTGVTFDPPLHWKEWDSREASIQDASSGEEQSKVESLEDEVRSANFDRDDVINMARSLQDKVNSTLQNLQNGAEMLTREELIELLQEYDYDLEEMTL